MIVYVVTSGSYSEYQIDCIFDSELAAATYCDKMNEPKIAYGEREWKKRRRQRDDHYAHRFATGREFALDRYEGDFHRVETFEVEQ